MVRKRTTLYIDEGLLKSARDLASRTDREEQDVVEDALRRYLGFQMLEQVWSRSDLPNEEEATRLAYDELRALRVDESQGDEHLAR
jgi:hypothetical protein